MSTVGVAFLLVTGLDLCRANVLSAVASRTGIFDSNGDQLGELSGSSLIAEPPPAIEFHTSTRRARYVLVDNAMETRSDVTSSERRNCDLVMPHSERDALIEPSLLASDIGSLSAAARTVAAAGAEWVHVDINDGSSICQRSLSSLGPASVAAVRTAAPSLHVDVHLYTVDPEAHVAEVAKAGASRITFQWEALLLDSTEARVPSGADAATRRAAALARARALAASIRAAGCTVGCCLAPSTAADEIAELCDADELELVNVLSVEPGIGGQPFQPTVMDKVRRIRAAHPKLPLLMVDGGIDATTAPLAAAAGANALVSGSYLFKALPGQMGERLEVLEHALKEHGD